MVESGQSTLAVKVNLAKMEDIKREAGIDLKWLIGIAVAVIALLIAVLAWIKPFAPK
jgi:hypothetical protein